MSAGEELWTCVATCRVCGAELNRAEQVPEKDKWQVSMTAVLVALCDIPEHNTFSDCNFGVQLDWIAEQEEEPAQG